jgi:hypothetical protein
MAGIKPFFLTGANAKIRVNNITLAYCTNLSYSIVVNHASPKVLGMFESTSIEPLGYSVSGSFTVIRYIADAVAKIGGKAHQGTAQKDQGNGIGGWGKGGIEEVLLGGRVTDSFNPSKMDKATGFDLEIFQKVSGSQIAVAKIRGARITKMDFNLAKGFAATQTFQFTALYADEDSFLADFSGQGQQWQ